MHDASCPSASPLCVVQATVQATLANLPMDQVQSAYAPTDPAYAENMRWAEEALVTAVFCIIICGAWGTLSIRYLAPFLLQKVQQQPFWLLMSRPCVPAWDQMLSVTDCCAM